MIKWPKELIENGALHVLIGEIPDERKESIWNARGLPFRSYKASTLKPDECDV